jgi:pyrroline-5-carboxylate reductase
LGMAMTSEKSMGFLGAGNLAEALIKGILKAGIVSPKDILASDVSRERLKALKERYKISTYPRNTEVALKSDIIVLAVKPQVIREVLDEVAPIVDESKIIISVAAGIPLSVLSSILSQGKNKHPRIIRAMPNTPALVQEGATALAKGLHASEGDLKAALNIFNAVGKTVVVAEALMDAVTGLSGSGPAYICAVVEALSDAGVKMGLSRDVSYKLSLQTLLGTARLLEETGKNPSQLKEMVTSPGGTTIFGLHALEKGKLKNTLMNAVEAATARSRELGLEADAKKTA